MQLSQATLPNVATIWNNDRRWNARHADSRIARWRADRLCNGNRTCMPPRLGLHSCRWSCVGKDQSVSTCNTHKRYWSLAQPYKGTHAYRRQVTTALFSQWLWIWAQVSQLWCRYGRRRQWSEGNVDEVYGLIERMCPGGRKIETFGRRHNIRPGWLTPGNHLGPMDQICEEDLLKRVQTKWVSA